MKLTDFNYHLPEELIAHKPKLQRDKANLLVFDQVKNKIEHKKFFQITDYLKKGDVLVLNNSKVMPCRLIGKKENTGGKIEVLLIKNTGQGWEAIVGGKAREDLKVNFAKNFSGILRQRIKDNIWLVQFNVNDQAFYQYLEKFGKTPLPPYIKSQDSERSLKSKYQTVYAKQLGSAAAPTAGFHFTKKLLTNLNKKGVQIEYISLHVGLGTFAPVRENIIEKHKMHAEVVEVDCQTAKRIWQAKNKGQRIIAVGTTSVRVLEGVIAKNKSCNKDFLTQTNIFVYPGYEFKLVDAMITNFHLPKSTLLMLVSAFIGRGMILQLYDLAIAKKYRFYSFGDAMFLIKKS